MKVLAVFCLFVFICNAQDDGVYFSAGDGLFVAGYVDGGAFINFTGPNVNYKSGNSMFILGMLPSLRFKNDQGETQNSFITPNLGVGLTYSYKLFTLQLPFYYNVKTSTNDGQWHVGFGLGINIGYISKSRKKRESK